MNWFKKHYQELLNTHSSPKSVASGFASGAFIAVLPTPGIGIILGLFVLFIFPKINKLSLFIAFAIFNPFVLTPIYALSYKLGDYLLKDQSIRAFDFLAGNSFYHLTLRLITGSIILAILISLISYFTVYYLIKSKK